jgi:hypothetical protein
MATNISAATSYASSGTSTSTGASNTNCSALAKYCGNCDGCNPCCNCPTNCCWSGNVSKVFDNLEVLGDCSPTTTIATPAAKFCVGSTLCVAGIVVSVLCICMCYFSCSKKPVPVILKGQENGNAKE